MNKALIFSIRYRLHGYDEPVTLYILCRRPWWKFWATPDLIAVSSNHQNLLHPALLPPGVKADYKVKVYSGPPMSSLEDLEGVQGLLLSPWIVTHIDGSKRLSMVKGDRCLTLDDGKLWLELEWCDTTIMVEREVGTKDYEDFRKELSRCLQNGV